MWLFLAILIPSVFSQCAQKSYGADKIVCVCNSTYCDELPRLPNIGANEAIVIQSSLSGKRFETKTINFGGSGLQGLLAILGLGGPMIIVDSSQKYQEIIGFGGSFTDSVGINLASLSQSTQDQLLKAYFSQNGLEYTTGRVPIASTDFSTREYSYDDSVGDTALANFSLAAEDLQYKIPFIQKALNLSGGNLKLFSSPWSAPGWMKTSGQMKGGGALKEDPAIHTAYANYFVRFFEEYQKKGITFWASTIQNEPSSGLIPGYPWQTMFFSSFSQRDFVKKYLGPAMQNNSIAKEVKLITFDDNRWFLPGWADIMFKDPYVSSLVAGSGVHWYWDAFSPADFLAFTHKSHSDKFILATEACAGSSGIRGPILGDWDRAEDYAKSIISDLSNFVAGWTDWNLCLNDEGGPTWVNNFVDSPIIVNKTSDEFYKQPMFYVMGHFSKFMRPGAVRISSMFSLTAALSLQAVATDLNGQRVLVILNQSPVDVPSFSVSDKQISGKSLSLDLPAHSITTVVWNNSAQLGERK